MAGEMAFAGTPLKPLEPINAFDFAFSDPFVKDSTHLQNTLTQQQRDHNIPPVPPTKPIFVSPHTGATVTRQKIRDDASSLAIGLREKLAQEKAPYATVSPVVLVHLPNSVNYVSIVLGIFASGYTASLANPQLTPTELQHIISLARPAIVITTTRGLSIVKTALDLIEDQSLASKLSAPGLIFIHDAISAGLVEEGASNLGSLLRLVTNDFEAAQLTEQSSRKHTGLILWSSGTTGKSKGVCLSHSAVIHNNMCMWHIDLALGAEERWLGFIPFYHVFGLVVIALFAPAIGATVHVMPRFEQKLVLDLIQRERITILHAAPPVALLLAKSPLVEGRDFSNVRYILSGAAPLGREVVELVYKRLGVMVFMAYGLSEGGFVSMQYSTTWAELVPHLGDTGFPQPGNQVKVVSLNDPKKVLNIGDEGEILFKSPGLMIGYLDNEAATGEVLDAEGWYRTGDIGKIDSTGSIWITDRVKEMIKVKGLQVSPADLEAVLCGSPHIDDAGVTAIYDAATVSEYPRAYIVPKDQALIELCRKATNGSLSPELAKLSQEVKDWTEPRMAKYKWLKGGLLFVPEIPKSPSGKILRRLLKDTKGVGVQLYPENLPRESRLWPDALSSHCGKSEVLEA